MNAVLTSLLELSTLFLGLAVLVQILQEIHKFLTSSKARAFEQALSDFAGPFVVNRLKQDARLTVRGPLQFRRVSIAGRVLPMNADDLFAAIEKGAPEWQRIAARALDFEAALQRGRPAPPSPKFGQTIAGLTQQLENAAVDAQSASFGDATNVARFLWDWKLIRDNGQVNDAEFDAARVREAFRREFLPQFETIQRHYDQFLQNFGYLYRRRTLRQTFTIAFAVAVLFNMPFEQVYVRETALTPQQVVTLAEGAQRLYDGSRQIKPGPDSEVLQRRFRTLADQALAAAASAAARICSPTVPDGIGEAGAMPPRAACESVASIDYLVSPTALWRSLVDGRLTSTRFLFGCLISALLMTFAARFLNDVSSSLLRAARPQRHQTGPAAPDRPISTMVG